MRLNCVANFEGSENSVGSGKGFSASCSDFNTGCNPGVLDIFMLKADRSNGQNFAINVVYVTD
jgi:hypothetical protein